MSNTHQICEVKVTLPSLGTITTDGSGNQIKHGDKCCVHLYAVKPEWRSGGAFEGFTVGWLTYEGYSELPFKQSKKIIMPDGYKLIALSVDERGIPVSWESLPVQFVGGLINLNDADGAFGARTGNIHSAEPFIISRDGPVFVTDAKIGNGVLSTNYSVKLNINNYGKEHPAGMAVGVEDGQGKAEFKAEHLMVNEAASSIIINAVASNMKIKTSLCDEMKLAIIDAVRESDLFTAIQVNIDAQTASLTGLQQAMHDAVNDAIRNALKPGGAIWVQQRAR